MKYLVVLFVLIPLLYFANYHRLASAYNPNGTVIAEMEKYTDHVVNSYQEFKPAKIDPPKTMFRITDEIPYMGTHYIDALRYLKPFNPEKPAGVITWRGEVVAYQYYSDKPVGDYHWHKHNNLCGTENMVVKYEWGFWQCLFKGYLPFPNFAQKYMVHVWVVDNPGGVNDLWNPNLR